MQENNLKIHLGCGSRFIPGFVHVDLTEYDHVDHMADVRDLSMFGDCTAELVYASHILEYFDWQEAPAVLAEWKRVLKRGGLLRLSVPDFGALVEIYGRTGCLAAVAGPLYGRWETGDGVLYHKSVYDYASLSFLLRSVGFRGVRRWDWRGTEHAHVDDFSQAYYPHMDEGNGVLVSLNVEAAK